MWHNLEALASKSGVFPCIANKNSDNYFNEQTSKQKNERQECAPHPFEINDRKPKLRKPKEIDSEIIQQLKYNIHRILIQTMICKSYNFSMDPRISPQYLQPKVHW